MMKFKKTKWMLSLLAILLAGSLTVGTLFARGYWDEKQAVHIRPKEIETSTVVIGTHLIHLSALNDTLYQVAKESAEQSGQDTIYYKSELGGDAWFDITSAESLMDITTEGVPVQDQVLEELFFTHHTKSDKKTYDLRTNSQINIFNIHNPYALESLEELQPLKTQYDLFRERMDGSGGEDKETRKKAKAIVHRIDEIWQTPVSGEDAPQELKNLEEQLTALQEYLDVLTDNGTPANETGVVSRVMKAVDAGRRYEVFKVLDPVINDYMNEISKDPEAPAELVSAAAQCYGNIQDALITHGGARLDKGVTVMSEAEFQYSNDLVKHAVDKVHDACDQDVHNLLLLDNINSDAILERHEELGLLNSPLIGRATSAYQQLLSAGETGEYRAEKAKHVSQAVLKRMRKEHSANVESKRGELEFLIEANTKRVDPEAAMAYIDQRLALTTETLATAIPKDDFTKDTRESVDKHIDFLTKLRRKMELALGGNEMDQLTEQKGDLQQKYLEALDNNELKKAKSLEKKIQALEEEIRAVEEEAIAQMDKLREEIAALEDGSAAKAAAEAELAQAEKGFSDGSLGAQVAELKEKALEGDQDALNAMTEMLATDPELVLPAMQDVYNDAMLNGGNPEVEKAIEKAILENPNALREDLSNQEVKDALDKWMDGQGGTGADGLGDGTGDGTDDGSGDGTGEGTEDGTGDGSGDGTGESGPLGGLTGADASNAAAAVLGLNLYYQETENPAVKQVMNSLLQQQLALGNRLFYNRIDDSSGEYIPLSTIEMLTGRRFIWNKNASLGVLAKAGDFYGFTMFSTQVIRDREGEKTEYMDRPCKQKSEIHIPEEYATEAFAVQCVYLADSTIGCGFDEELMKQAYELFEQLMALG